MPEYANRESLIAWVVPPLQGWVSIASQNPGLHPGLSSVALAGLGSRGHGDSVAI